MDLHPQYPCLFDKTDFKKEEIVLESQTEKHHSKEFKNGHPNSLFMFEDEKSSELAWSRTKMCPQRTKSSSFKTKWKLAESEKWLSYRMGP